MSAEKDAGCVVGKAPFDLFVFNHWYEPQGKPWIQRFRCKPRGFDQARLVPVGDKTEMKIN